MCNYIKFRFHFRCLLCTRVKTRTPPEQMRPSQKIFFRRRAEELDRKHPTRVVWRCRGKTAEEIKASEDDTNVGKKQRETLVWRSSVRSEEKQQIRQCSKKTYGCVGSLLSLQLPEVNAESKHFTIPFRPLKDDFYFCFTPEKTDAVLFMPFCGWMCGWASIVCRLIHHHSWPILINFLGQVCLF